MRSRMLAAVVVFLWGTAVAYAQDQTEVDEYTLGDITVQAAGEKPSKDAVDKEVLESVRFTHVGEALTEIPGVSVVRRGASATEPVIRGLGWEKVSTQVNGLPLYGACPARMDPPLTYVRSYTAENVRVVKGLGSVTYGPAGSGGRILIDTDYERDPDAPDEFDGWIEVGGETNRNGLVGELGAKGGNSRVDVKGVVEGQDYSDYESGDGVTVPADQKSYSGALSLGLRPHEDHRWSNYVNYVREDGIDYPTLPMDMDETDFWVYTTGYRIRPENGRLEELGLHGGLQLIDHTMSNRDKPNRQMLEAETPSESDTYNGSADFTFRLSPSVSLTSGADYYLLNRDATRTRRMVASGQTFEDRLWPDVSQSDLGGFAEIQADIAEAFDLRVGARIDRVSSQAKAADAPSLMMRSVREQYVRFYGPEAADVDQDETTGSGNLVLTWHPASWVETAIGGGIASRAAGVTERYFAFAPAPGGFVVGNPTLDPEKKIELEWNLGLTHKWFEAEMSVFYNWVNDYILQQQIARLDANGDGIDDVVRGFYNVDARLYGFEIDSLVRVNDHWSFPLTVAYVRGKNTTDDTDLPEIPPLEATAAVRADYGESTPWWVQFGGRFVSKQDKIDPSFPEQETSGFSVFHLRGGVTLRRVVKLELGVENLFDKDYTEHLTRDAFFTEGDLVAGEPVPAPGLTVYGSLRWTF